MVLNLFGLSLKEDLINLMALLNLISLSFLKNLNSDSIIDMIIFICYYYLILENFHSKLSTYSVGDPKFFQIIQNKLHYAVHRHTAPELIVKRANADKENMGLTNWLDAPNGKIQKYDVSIAKNYLTEKEINFLERIVSMYLDYAELQAERNIPMTMEDWSRRLDSFLEFNDRDILINAGKISSEEAKLYAETQFEKYRIVQDRLFESDFDKQIKEILKDNE